jgi:hypothetical protein
VVCALCWGPPHRPHRQQEACHLHWMEDSNDLSLWIASQFPLTQLRVVYICTYSLVLVGNELVTAPPGQRPDCCHLGIHLAQLSQRRFMRAK